MSKAQSTLVVPSSPALGEPPTLHHVAWSFYCQLRDDPANDRLRMIYLDGDLTLMSPQHRHDMSSRRFFEIITTVAQVWDINYHVIGATTLRRRGKTSKQGAGKEPDEGFYLGADEARVRDNDDLDLSVDPPPSLAVEVDNTGNSRRALATYARLGVPEVWVYHVPSHALQFYRLEGNSYQKVDRSVVLPRLTTQNVLEALARRSVEGGDRQWVAWLETWARSLPELA
jgi:Uma2 family endonuclease